MQLATFDRGDFRESDEKLTNKRWMRKEGRLKRPDGCKSPLVSYLGSLNLLEPQIAKRFEAGTEEDRAAAQALLRKLEWRTAPPPCLRLSEAESYLAPNLQNQSAYTSMSPSQPVPSKSGIDRGLQSQKETLL